MGTTPNGIIYPDPADLPRRQALQDLAESVDDIFGSRGTWQAYSPTLTNFTLGNGTVDFARYVHDGDTVTARMRVTLGSSSSVTGGITISLPAPVGPGYVGGFDSIGTGFLTEGSSPASSRTGCTVYIASSGASTARLIVDRLEAGAVGPTTPWTWDAGDTFGISVTYEAS